MLQVIGKQKKVFSALITGNYRCVRLKGCTVLSATTWEKLIKTSPQLLTLELCSCPSIDDTFLLQIERAPFLNRLRLIDLPKLSLPRLPHPTLRRLEIIRCQALQQLLFSERLKHLSVKECWSLTSIEAKLYEKATLLRSSRLVKEAEGFVLESLHLYACPKLQPWWSLFADWLKASPQNGIDLRQAPLKHTQEQQQIAIGIASYLAGNRELDLSPTPITASDLAFLASNCQKLTSLNLSGCTKITDKDLTELSIRFPSMTQVIELESRKRRLQAVAFGAEQWAKYFGEVGAEPPLPPDIVDILSGPCPIWPGKTIGETHKLVLVPQTVDGIPLTFDRLGELIQSPRQGHATKHRYLFNAIATARVIKEAHGSTSIPWSTSLPSHWILMTKDVLPGSKYRNYAKQKAKMAALAGGYQVPRLLEAAVCILMEHVETGTRLFPVVSKTYTRCQEELEGYRMSIGGFAADGLNVGGFKDDVSVGVAGLRIF